MNEKVRDLLEEKTTRYIFPFFWLKGESEEVLRKYVNVIRDCGIRAFCLESRPHPDFCGPRWWHDLDIIIEEAKKYDMKIWILDDSHFPTGYCNGAFEKLIENNDFTLLRQSITFRTLKECCSNETVIFDLDKLVDAGESEKTRADKYFMKDYSNIPNDQLLDIIALKNSENELCMESLIKNKQKNIITKESQIIWEVPDGSWNIYGIYLTNNRGPHRDYMNMLSKASCHKLIESVYEPHWEHYKNEFGRTILGFFSDEPELGNGHIYQLDKRFFEINDLPWSYELQERLQNIWGKEWCEKLILLWNSKCNENASAQIRYQYMNEVTRLVEYDFSCQVGNWCREHGVQYIGHLIEDHNQHVRCGSSLGHYFRGLRGQDMAGIDDIGGQVLPQGEDLDIKTKWQDHRDGTFYHFALGKLATSAAAIEPEKNGNSMCEIFGNYGWKEGVCLEKYLADHFMVRGINHFVPHAFSAAEFPDRDCPPHFYAHGNNPQYRHFGKLMNYMERICHLISDGHSITHVAILYHAEADWCGGKNQPIEKNR